jgi:lipopolysaccharide export system permease protein
MPCGLKPRRPADSRSRHVQSRCGIFCAIRKPVHLAELLWRLGLPLAALNLAVLAIPLSFVNPRAGRTNNLIFALLTYMIYSNLLSVSQAWVAQGKLPFEIGVWAVHVGMFVLLIVLFYRRQNPLAWGRTRWR